MIGKIKASLWGAVLAALGYLQIYPGALADAWMAIPDDLKQYIPLWVAKAVSGSILFVTFLLKMNFMRIDKKNLKSQVEEAKSNGDNS